MTWRRLGDFQYSCDGRYAIQGARVAHGYSFALYDCDPPGDWPPLELLCVRDSADKCQKFLEEIK